MCRAPKADSYHYMGYFTLQGARSTDYIGTIGMNGLERLAIYLAAI